MNVVYRDSRLHVRTLHSSQHAEAYVSYVPRNEDEPLQEQAERMFGSIREYLEENGMELVQERVVCAPDAVNTLKSIRRDSYGKFAEEMPATWLLPKHHAAAGEPLTGVQLHAMTGNGACIRLDGTPYGRMMEVGARKHVFLSGLSTPGENDRPQAVRGALVKADRILNGLGADMRSVCRTWIWLDDINSWYNAFNSVRTRFLTERGMLGERNRQYMPASTAVGIASAHGAASAIDLVAVLGGNEAHEVLEEGGNQKSAFVYGSAFSRAMQTAMPAGRTLFVSGTAAIGMDGRTQYAGSVTSQIEATYDNVRAILAHAGFRESDIVQGVAYCKTRDVRIAYDKACIAHDRRWPLLPVMADICRDDLLFEIEVTALETKGSPD